MLLMGFETMTGELSPAWDTVLRKELLQHNPSLNNTLMTCFGDAFMDVLAQEPTAPCKQATGLTNAAARSAVTDSSRCHTALQHHGVTTALEERK